MTTFHSFFRDLALVERQTVVQGLYNIEPTVVEVQK